MEPDAKVLAEVKALIQLIKVTQDPVEQNRQWNRYYQLSDRVFPKAAELRARYKKMTGSERQRLKDEYMELVRLLWKATDPEAAYSVSFTEAAPPAKEPPAPSPQGKRRAPSPAARPRFPEDARPIYNWALVSGAIAVLAVVGGMFWAEQQGYVDGLLTRAIPSEVTELAREIEEEPVEEVPAVAEVTERIVAREIPRPEEKPVPLAEIEAELAASIVPEFQGIPAELRGRGDQVVVGAKRYSDVYVTESESQYFFRIPEDGSVESAVKGDATVTTSTDLAGREALLTLWKENQAAVEDADKRREGEKRERIAAHYAAQEAARTAYESAREKENWRVSVAQWLAMNSEQREAERIRAFNNWRAIEEDVETMQALYRKIALGYESVGISDTRASRLHEAYDNWLREKGPNFNMEKALLEYGAERKETLTDLAEKEAEYYRLLQHLEKAYPEYEARMLEIRRLDENLSPELYRIEVSVDWDLALQDKGAEGNGQSKRGTSVGTGFIVAEGYVMTCAHVVRRNTRIDISSTSGARYRASIVVSDISNDWALLKVPGLAGPPIPIAPGKPNVGATVFCLGYPLGGIKNSVDPIVGSGNIAALQRIDGDQRFLQVTAPINPGNSGGPVVDSQGHWVGIVSEKMNDLRRLQESQTVGQGLNYAVKATFVQPLVSTQRVGVELATASKDAVAPMALEAIVTAIAPSIVKIEVE